MSSTVTLSCEDFANYPHGLSLVSSADGRGNFITFGLFKNHGSGKNGNKRTYTLVGLLCYVGGEFRDGFVQEEILENEVLSIVQKYFQIVHTRIPLVKVPAEEAASFVILYCNERSSKKKLEITDSEIQKGIDLFKRAAKYSCYKDNSDYLVQNLGKFLKDAKYHRLNHERREFESWWIESPEMERNKCPPLPLTKDVLKDSIFIHSMIQPVAEWKEKVAELISTEENYDRFSGMSRHMGFWFSNKKSPNFKLAATMFQYYDRILEWKRSGSKFDVDSPVIQMVLSLTLQKLNEQGWSAGKPRQPVSLCTSRKTCNICLAPVQKGEANNDITCVTKQHRACFGDNTLREVMSVVLDDVKAFGLPREAISAVRHVIAKGFLSFFVHCFTTHLFWKELPTRIVIDKLVETCSLNLMRYLINKPDKCWVQVTYGDIQEQMRTICDGKISDKSIELVSRHFREACQSIGPKNDKYNCLRNNQGKVIAVKAYVMEPYIGAHLKLRWNFMSEEKRKDILMCTPDMIDSAIWGAYKEATLVFVKRLEQEHKQMAKERGENDTSFQACPEKTQQEIMRKVCKMHGCEDGNCACHNFTKFKQFFLASLPMICKGEKSFLLWEGDKEPDSESTGKLVFNNTIFLNNDNDSLTDIISGDDRTVFDNIEKNCEVVKSCTRLACLTETTYYRIFLALKCKIIQEYSDVALLEDYGPLCKEYYRPVCAGCQWEENSPERFQMCGGCKRVYYCSKGCQRHHWKISHRENCRRTNMEKIPETN